MSAPRINIPSGVLESFCRRWKIRELALFGSVLRDDFGAASDVDVLVTFEPNDDWSLWDMVAMKGELEAMVGRPVDLVEKRAISNPFRLRRILDSHQVIYAA